MSCTQVLVLLSIVVFATTVYAYTGFGPGEQYWDYIEVREGAYMFYWLYHTTANVANYTDRPLVIWLQGGPGGSSTGVGNFEEIGPLDINSNYRNSTWVKDVNVLFIDNPVGAGFSYVEKLSLLTTNNKQIALDLVELMKGFYHQHPEFETVPLHIFCQSYGGKMAPEFALELYNAIQKNEIKSNLTSVVLGNPWTSPIDSVLNWAPLLWNMGIVDKSGYNKIMTSANKTLNLIKSKKWSQANLQRLWTVKAVLEESKGVDFYNIAKPIRSANILLRSNNYQDFMYRTLEELRAENNAPVTLESFMRDTVSEALGISSNVKWSSQRQATITSLWGDFMKPAIHIVNELLNKTTVKVGVYSGQFDLICATAGTVDWIDKLSYTDRDNYINAPRQAISINGILEGYKKSTKKFAMFWVNRAGHRVPTDNPTAMGYILNYFTNYDLTAY